jgi:2-succinyl-5-enolpyruvyl-6-hydroxy-3-cyclohexene-1-carboxylate synthase
MCATFVDEWATLGADVAMVSPGSRSTPMALAIASHPGMAMHVFIDERVASFAAVGAARLRRKPVIVLCTSGTAATEFHSAVVEAHQSDVPMIVLTADRPPELQGVGAPQTIDQANLYGTAVRRFIDVGVADARDAGRWRSVARDIVAAAVGGPGGAGPVHVNLPFREPLVAAVGALPPRENGLSAGDDPAHGRIDAAAIDAEALDAVRSLLTDANGSLRRGVIIAGGCPSDAAVLELARAAGWPVWADPRSGLRVEHPNIVAAVDPMLRDDAVAQHLSPDVVVRFGSLPASKVVGTRLREWACTHVCVTTGPQLMDPDRLVTRHVVADDAEFARTVMAGLRTTDPAWLREWQSASNAADRAVAAELGTGSLTEPAVAHLVARASAARGPLWVSSSMPIRDVEWFAPATNGLFVIANRGANGIDGVTSSAIGSALVSDRPVTLLIGDVAFLHDSSALVGLARRGCDLRIVLVDNRGGAIFSFLPQAGELDEQTFETLFGTPNDVDIASLAKAHGVAYGCVTTRDELVSQLALTGPQIVHVRTDRRRVVTDHEAVYRSVGDAVRTALSLG